VLFMLKIYLISSEGNNFPDIQTFYEKPASFSLNVSAVKKCIEINHGNPFLILAKANNAI